MGSMFPILWWIAMILTPIFILGIHDIFQNKHAILKNFPVLGHFRYLFEMVRPELQQYFVESNTDGRPIPREIRSVIYQRAKGELQTVPFGTQHDLYEEKSDWVYHSLTAKHIEKKDFSRIIIGSSQCTQKYSCSLFNISAMSYGSLSAKAIECLNKGAKIESFFHNTGEGGVSSHHLNGGDLCWQIGTGYFGCRHPDGTFNPEMFKQNVSHNEVKLIEVKLSQGAKPGHGGILPAAKVSKEIAKIRGVNLGENVLSPPCHSAFSTPQGLLEFIQKLRELSGGKPVGFKLCVGNPQEVVNIAKAIKELNIFPDFIAVDGAEGGTGAAPLEYTNHVGHPLEEGLVLVDNILKGYGIRNEIKIIASGKVFTGFDLLKILALGADVTSSARGMMLALGCIQALLCNTNKCPVGIATTDKGLALAINVPDKSQRVASYQRETVKAFYDILGSMGLTSSTQLNRNHIRRRVERDEVKTFYEIHPEIESGAFLDPLAEVPASLKNLVENSNSSGF